MMEIGELEGLRAARLSWAQICRLMFVRWLYRIGRLR
jgi:hypothetical protein